MAASLHFTSGKRAPSALGCNSMPMALAMGIVFIKQLGKDEVYQYLLLVYWGSTNGYQKTVLNFSNPFTQKGLLFQRI